MTSILCGGLVVSDPIRATLPPGFEDLAVIDGVLHPTTVVFSADGRVFVAEKGGRILAFDSLADPEPTVFADLRPQVLNHGDRGLISIALAPDFPGDPWVYLLYTADLSVDETFNATNEYPPKWGDSDPWSDSDPCLLFRGGCIASGRLSRIEDIDGVGGPEQILIQDWFQQFSSHSVGDLMFADDGMLYVSAGDAASYHVADLGSESTSGNPAGDPLPDDPANEGGAFRTQDLETDSDDTGLSGAILRIDPATGAGAPGNPLIASSRANERRIIAYGLRNPYRLALRDNGELWIAEVGWNSREEIDRLASPGSELVNFGWPCWEGNMPATQSSPSLPFTQTAICQRLYDPDSAHGLPDQPHVPHTPPVKDYKWADSQPCNVPSASRTALGGLVFHPGTGDYPAPYSGSLFVGEYSRGCIARLVDLDPVDGVPETFVSFIDDTAGSLPVDLAIGPGGDLFYVHHAVNGAIRRLRYGGNEPPTAVIGLAPGSSDTGEPPLSVTFDAGPSDDDAGYLTYQWDFDNDGQFDDSTALETTRVFELGTHTVRLRVEDGEGLSDVTTREIVVESNDIFADGFESGDLSSWS